MKGKYLFLKSSGYAGDDETSYQLTATSSDTNDVSTLTSVSTTQPFTTGYVITKTEKTIMNANVTTTSEGYSSTLGKDVWLCLFSILD
jgi:hypothetical protein